MKLVMSKKQKEEIINKKAEKIGTAIGEFIVNILTGLIAVGKFLLKVLLFILNMPITTGIICFALYILILKLLGKF